MKILKGRMKMTDKRKENRSYYLRNRQRIIERVRKYYNEYARHGLRKPKLELTPEERQEHRRQMEHARYLRNRTKILEQQRVYRETHKEEIRERRRKRNFERVYGRIKQYTIGTIAGVAE